MAQILENGGKKLNLICYAASLWVVDVWEFWLEENDGELPQMMCTAGMAH